ncbi:MAG TPA: hypothetical protein VH393_06075 [Ktedonobacterales bacterium]|jgi:hypothetical protein
MENKRNAVVRWGLTFGLIMATLGSVSAVGSRLLEGSLISGETTPEQFLPTAGVALLIGCGLDLVYLALFFVAGIMTARQSGSVGAASLSGLLAGGVGALVNGAISVILLFVLPSTLSPLGTTSALNSDTSDSAVMIGVVVGAVIGLIFGLLIWGGLGAGLGALGGLIGQNQFRSAHPELAQPYPYAYAPYAGYPPAPPMGAYPPPPPPPGAYPPPPEAYPPPPGASYPPAPPAEQPPVSGTYPSPDAFPPSQPGQ